jgi:hypothetical protein
LLAQLAACRCPGAEHLPSEGLGEIVHVECNQQRDGLARIVAYFAPTHGSQSGLGSERAQHKRALGKLASRGHDVRVLRLALNQWHEESACVSEQIGFERFGHARKSLAPVLRSSGLGCASLFQCGFAAPLLEQTLNARAIGESLRRLAVALDQFSGCRSGGYGQAHHSLGRIARFVAKREREEGLCFMAHLLGALPDTVGVLRLAKQSVVALEVLERRAVHLRI